MRRDELSIVKFRLIKVEALKQTIARDVILSFYFPGTLMLYCLDFGEFDLTVKKKKKKKTTILDEELGEDLVDSSGDSWLTSERDYTYEEVRLLSCLEYPMLIHSTTSRTY